MKLLMPSLPCLLFPDNGIYSLQLKNNGIVCDMGSTTLYKGFSNNNYALPLLLHNTLPMQDFNIFYHAAELPLYNRHLPPKWRKASRRILSLPQTTR